ncbi:hypothetical protein [Magnetococcus sp. PR-3]|uniref:hypothetical protein n=1 Tax=Magnetococcus sp. PR-3 TaxID=3120355 RepID=UPI002FCE0968
MDEDIIVINDLKPGTKVSIEFGNMEPVLTKMDEPKKFLMEDWSEDEMEIYILEDQIEEDEPLHYALEPMTLEEGLKRNEGKFGVNRIMWNFLGREVEGFEVEEAEEEEAEEAAE